MTGWAQVNGYSGSGRDCSTSRTGPLRLDLKILLMTAFGGMINSEKLGVAKEEGKNDSSQPVA